MNAIVQRLGLAIATVAGATALTFGIAAPPEHCPEYSADEFMVAATAAANWLIDNQQPDGRWLYEYNRTTDVDTDDYNVVRHAGVMMSLYQAGARGIAGAIESADRGLTWALDNVVDNGEWSTVTTTKTAQAGTNALLVAALAERRLTTGDSTYDPFMERLARFLTTQTEPSGALLAYYDLGDDQPRADTYSIYYTGEAYWALGRMHAIDPNAEWGRTADSIGDYMATVRDDVEEVWPPLADHWSGYGLAETAASPTRRAGEPLTDNELEFVRRQGGLIGQRVRSISQRFGPWGPFVRGTFTPRGGGYGVFGEGLAGLWRASTLDRRLVDERGALAERTMCIGGLAVEAQVTAQEAADYPDPGKVEGAWFIDETTRMDDQQHALSALLLTVPIVESVPFDTGQPSPALWLWLIAIVGTINPLRAAFQLPKNATMSRRVSLAALGGGLGALALMLLGSLSGWAIATGETSAPAMRLAAGALCLLSAGVDLARPQGNDEPSLKGLGAAAIPIALPLFIRPVMVIVGLSTVADHGLRGYFAGLAVTVALLIGAAALSNGADPERPVLGWLAKLLSVAAIAAGALLVADAVFDI